MGTLALGLTQVNCKEKRKAPDIEGFEKAIIDPEDLKPWEAISDRKVRVGLAGYGVCEFAAEFSFQNHPNVEVIAVSDLIPERCAELAKVTNCRKTYPSLEEMVKDDKIEAVFCATDAPSHARHAILCLKHGKHVAVAVPAVFGSLEEADMLLEEVKKSGLKYMMYETSCFHADLYAMREIYKAGGFGKLVYSEGEYWHYSEKGIDSYKGWRHGMPPMWYLTHASAYHIGVTDGYFTEVSCMGMPSYMERYQPENNRYKNPFATQIALFRTNDGGMARMCRSADTPGFSGEIGRIRGERGTFYDKYEGQEKNLPDLRRPGLPPSVEPGYHGGSHGHLTDEFISSILLDRKPLIDVAISLNMTVPGIIAHQSSLKDGELLPVPHYEL